MYAAPDALLAILDRRRTPPLAWVFLNFFSHVFRGGSVERDASVDHVKAPFRRNALADLGYTNKL